jgi:hypothetical protein
VWKDEWQNCFGNLWIKAGGEDVTHDPTVEAAIASDIYCK